MCDKIIEIKLKKAVAMLYDNQPNINVFTSETNQTEWNLAHHLANEIHKEFSGLDCDLDISKPNIKRMRPDIIIHKRRSPDLNLLIIEVKKDGTPSALERDEKKIKEYWFKAGRLNYRYGAIINLKTHGAHQIVVFVNENYLSSANPK